MPDIRPPPIELTIERKEINLEIGQTILVNQTIISNGGLQYKRDIVQSDLVGSLAVLQHNLNITVYDVTVQDSSGEISIPWKPLGLNHISLDFTGLVPLTEIYKLLIQV